MAASDLRRALGTQVVAGPWAGQTVVELVVDTPAGFTLADVPRAQLRLFIIVGVEAARRLELVAELARLVSERATPTTKRAAA